MLEKDDFTLPFEKELRIIFIILSLWMFCLCAYLSTRYVSLCLQRPKENIGSPGTEATDGCEPLRSIGNGVPCFHRVSSVLRHWTILPALDLIFQLCLLSSSSLPTELSEALCGPPVYRLSYPRLCYDLIIIHIYGAQCTISIDIFNA